MIGLRDLLRQAAVRLLMRFLVWFVFIGAIAVMPDELDWRTLAICWAVVLLRWIWGRKGMLWLGQKLGLFQPPPERLRKIVVETATKMNVPFHGVLLMRTPLAQAYALVNSRELVFTERLLELHSDNEIAAICAHELGHLTEPKSARFMRNIGLLTYLPWLLLNPLLHVWGMSAFFGLLLLTFGVPYLSRKISRSLEVRADRFAKLNEAEPGNYARALAKLYEDNLVPAVMAKNRRTHPDLYDRLLAAGVTPDFPRPVPPIAMAWQGRILAGAAGILFVIFVMHMVELNSR